MWIITDELLAQARDANGPFSRAERTAIFNDRMIEERAANKCYANGESIKATIDAMVARGGIPSCKRGDIVGREYAKMVMRRR